MDLVWFDLVIYIYMHAYIYIYVIYVYIYKIYALNVDVNKKIYE